MHQTTGRQACFDSSWNLAFTLHQFCRHDMSSARLLACYACAHPSTDSILWTHRAVQHPSQSAAASPPVPETNSHIKPSTSAAGGNCPPDTALHQDDASCEEASSPATASDSASGPASAGRHKVGADSTWAVRQSAELEDLQAALDKQCFRRGRQAVGAIAAAAAAPSAALDVDQADIAPPQDLQDALGPKYDVLHAASADDALLCFAACSPHQCKAIGCNMHDVAAHCHHATLHGSRQWKVGGMVLAASVLNMKGAAAIASQVAMLCGSIVLLMDHVTRASGSTAWPVLALSWLVC